MASMSFITVISIGGIALGIMALIVVFCHGGLSENMEGQLLKWLPQPKWLLR